MEHYSVNTNQKFNGVAKITILHRLKDGYSLQEPVVADGIKWETEVQGAPGKLTFKVYKDDSGNLDFQEADIALLTFQPENQDVQVVFRGYIFSKKRTKDNWIEVTAYDQIRYFKNKHTLKYTNQKASDVVKTIAEKYAFEVGEIEDTNYVIGSRLEDDQSLLDIIQNALDLTMISTGKRYVLYDHDGKIYLRDVDSMKTNILINKSVAEDFDYKTSIDDNTYNEVELYYDNDDTNKREVHTFYNGGSIDDWGRLRITESVKNPANIKDRAQQMLKLYNRKGRELKVSGAFGDISCRAGASVICQLYLGDIDVEERMLIKSATHTFNHGDYRMDLTLDIYSEVNSNSTEDTYSYNEIQVKTTPKTDNVDNAVDVAKGTTPSDSNSEKQPKDESRIASRSLYTHDLKRTDKDVIAVTVNVPEGKGRVEVEVDKGLLSKATTYFITKTTTFYIKNGWYFSIAPEPSSGQSYIISKKYGAWIRHEYKSNRYYYTLWSPSFWRNDFDIGTFEDYSKLDALAKTDPYITIRWVR